MISLYKILKLYLKEKSKDMGLPNLYPFKA